MTGETWISVDVETSGPTPGTGSLIEIGACLVSDIGEGIELLLRPDPDLPWSAEAEAIHLLDRDVLAREGLEPADAMARFAEWIEAMTPAGSRPVMVALNAPFDWMFVAEAFWRWLGRNPFGTNALDLKALYLGRHLSELDRWADTKRRQILELYPVELPHTHRALDDAREQGLICRSILESAGRRP